MEPTILATLEERIQPRRTALFVVDMQKDFCLEGFGTHRVGRDLGPTRAIIPIIGNLLDTARDCGVLVAHIGFWTLPDNLSDSGSWLAQRRRSTVSSDTLAIAGSEGAEFIEELAPRAGELVVHKHRYSGFKGTDLDMVLRAREIETVVITGVSTNVCVESTLRDAFENNFYVCVPGDAVASWNMELHAATLATVDARFGLVTTADEVIRIWRAAAKRTAAAE